MKTQMALEKNPENAVSGENLQTMALAIEKIIENITTQSQINTSIVTRLLELERKIEVAAGKCTRRGPARKR
ncbi:MAG: hypothetical protein WB780_19045 [Candidatus Acidiferrales bacterium]